MVYIPDNANFPETNPIPKDVWAEAVDLVMNSFYDNSSISHVVTGGHAYDRKGYVTVDDLGGPRNESYGYDDDDVLLSVSVQLPSKVAQPLIDKVTALRDEIERDKKIAEARSLTEQIIELTEKRTKLYEELGE